MFILNFQISSIILSCKEFLSSVFVFDNGSDVCRYQTLYVCNGKVKCQWFYYRRDIVLTELLKPNVLSAFLMEVIMERSGRI